jgi:type IV secretory pathway VirB4 component
MAKKEMQSGQLSGNKPQTSTQSFLDVSEIKEGTIVLKDGSLRAVIAVSSTNFSLKSTEEQNALINSYQGFINSLNFPIQIVMQSRKLDIHAYLDKLRSIMQEQTNELLRMQTQEYIEYIGKLVEFASIMNKSFYILVPYTSGVAVQEDLMKKIGRIFNPVSTISSKKQEFGRNRDELMQRVNQLTSSLGSMGLRSVVLNTEELIELLYNSYNLSNASQIKIKDVEQLDLAQTND